MNSFQSKSSDPWQPCPPGTIAGLSSDQLAKIRARRRFFGQLVGVGGAAIGVSAIATLSVVLIDQPKESAIPGGIACVKVHEHLADFVAEQIRDPQLRAQISRHLFKCVSCQTAFHELNKGHDFRCNELSKTIR